MGSIRVYSHTVTAEEGWALITDKMDEVTLRMGRLTER
jgi:hypothetical protein